METGNVNLNSLNAGQELNPLAYALGQYPDKSIMLDYIFSNINKPAVDIDLDAMSMNGTVVQDEMDTYLSSKYIGSSGLKQCLVSPRTFYYSYIEPFERKQQPHFELGTFAHMAFIEPELFDKVKVAPQVNLATKAGVVEMIHFYEVLNYGKETDVSDAFDMQFLKQKLNDEKEKCTYQIIKEEHYQIIQALKKNYYWYGNGIIPLILKGAKSETSFYATDESTGIDIKVRPDFFNTKENIGVDAVISFKTTRHDNIDHFIYSAAKLKYELSEGMYQEVMSYVSGRQFNVTIMIMLQTVPPYDVAVLWWDPEDLQLGKYKYANALQTVKDCFDKKLFPGFDARAESGNYGIIDMKLPEWSMKEIAPVDIEY